MRPWGISGVPGTADRTVHLLEVDSRAQAAPQAGVPPIDDWGWESFVVRRDDASEAHARATGFELPQDHFTRTGFSLLATAAAACPLFAVASRADWEGFVRAGATGLVVRVDPRAHTLALERPNQPAVEIAIEDYAWDEAAELADRLPLEFSRRLVEAVAPGFDEASIALASAQLAWKANPDAASYANRCWVRDLTPDARSDAEAIRRALAGARDADQVTVPIYGTARRGRIPQMDYQGTDGAPAILPSISIWYVEGVETIAPPPAKPPSRPLLPGWVHAAIAISVFLAFVAIWLATR